MTYKALQKSLQWYKKNGRVGGKESWDTNPELERMRICSQEADVDRW